MAFMILDLRYCLTISLMWLTPRDVGFLCDSTVKLNCLHMEKSFVNVILRPSVGNAIMYDFKQEIILVVACVEHRCINHLLRHVQLGIQNYSQGLNYCHYMLKSVMVGTWLNSMHI